MANELVRIFRINYVRLNVPDRSIEPTEHFAYFHADCWPKWFARDKLRASGRSYSMVELEIDPDNIKPEWKCKQCKQPMKRETITI